MRVTSNERIYGTIEMNILIFQSFGTFVYLGTLLMIKNYNVHLASE